MSHQSEHLIDSLSRIRTRPGLYIGGLNVRGLNQLLTGLIEDLLCNSNIDSVRTQLLKDGAARVELCGASNKHLAFLPPGEMTVELLGGVIACAMCSHFECETVADGVWTHTTYIDGVETAAKSGPSDAIASITVKLTPARPLFPDHTQFEFHSLARRFQEFAIFNPATTFTLSDERASNCRSYRYSQGLYDYVRETLDLYYVDVYRMKLVDRDEEAEAIIILNSLERDVRCFVNGAACSATGPPTDGLRRALSKVIPEKRSPDGRYILTSAGDVLKYTTAVISLKLKEPSFGGATKWALTGYRPKQLVYRMVTTQLPGQIRQKAPR